jgi:hypothetical protein
MAMMLGTCAEWGTKRQLGFYVNPPCGVRMDESMKAMILGTCTQWGYKESIRLSI